MEPIVNVLISNRIVVTDFVSPVDSVHFINPKYIISYLFIIFKQN
jgi:hypothetical protein